MTGTVRDRLRKNAILHGFTDDELDSVFGVMQEQTVDAGTTIVQQGEVGHEFFVVDEGAAEVRLEEQGLVAQIGPGGCFGEHALITAKPRAATVVAATPMRLFSLRKEHFAALMQERCERKQAEHEVFLRESCLSLLRGLDAFERSVVLNAVQERYVPAGGVVVEEGARGDEFFIVLDGECKVTKRGTAGECSPRLGGGHHFGERALLTMNKLGAGAGLRQATVTATRDTTLLRIHASTFTRVMLQFDEHGPISPAVGKGSGLQSLALNMLVGGLSSGIAAICTNPLDVLKTDIQMAAKAAATIAKTGGAPPPPTTLMSALLARLHTRGPLSLADGVPSAMLRALSYSAIRLGACVKNKR